MLVYQRVPPMIHPSSPWSIPPHLLRHAAQQYRALSAQQLRTSQRGARVVRETHVVQQDHARTGDLQGESRFYGDFMEIIWWFL